MGGSPAGARETNRMLSESISSLARCSIQTIARADASRSPRLTTATSPRRNTVKPVPQLIAAAALFCAAAASHALDVKPYSAAALAEAQKADKPVALHFRADWCPTCRAQDKLLDAMKAESGLDITVLAVNYDTEKDLKKQFAIRSQSTLVVLRGQKETSRSINDTTAAGLRSALKTAL
jgi:thioredoxin 1